MEWSQPSRLACQEGAYAGDLDRSNSPFAAGKPPIVRTFKIGDHVGWNSEVGRVSGRIVRVHTKDVNYKGYVHHASEDDPQYEIKSDKTDHVALHKGQVLRHLGR